MVTDKTVKGFWNQGLEFADETELREQNMCGAIAEGPVEFIRGIAFFWQRAECRQLRLRALMADSKPSSRLNWHKEYDTVPQIMQSRRFHGVNKINGLIYREKFRKGFE